jgi:hypothetical protein
VYKLDRSGELTTLHSFNGLDGRNPEAALVEGSGRSLYGTTPEGGPRGGGVVFRVILIDRDPLRFVRGDCNKDGGVDLSDAACILGWLFLGEPEPGCMASINANGDQAVDISDVVTLLGSLYLGGSPPADPFPLCGPGRLPTDVAMGCATPPKSCPP